MLATCVSFFGIIGRVVLTILPSRTQSLKKFEVLGGVVPGTEESRGKISLDRPNRQWDYPCVVVSVEV